MGASVLCFWKHTDAETSVSIQTAVFVHKDFGAHLGHLLARGISDCFVEKYGSQLVQPPSARFTAFKHDLFSYFHTVPNNLALDIAKHMPVSPPWIMALYSDGFSESVSQAGGVPKGGQEKGGSYAFKPVTKRWWWQRINKSSAQADTDGEGLHSHVFDLRDQQSVFKFKEETEGAGAGGTEAGVSLPILSDNASERLLNLVWKMGRALAVGGGGSTGEGGVEAEEGGAVGGWQGGGGDLEELQSATVLIRRRSRKPPQKPPDQQEQKQQQQQQHILEQPPVTAPLPPSSPSFDCEQQLVVLYEKGLIVAFVLDLTHCGGHDPVNGPTI
jgi:hypothetical protein